VLPVPHVQDGLTIAPPSTENSGREGTKNHIPDNGICERFHRALLDEFYRVAFRTKIYQTTKELPADLDAWLGDYNERRPHQGRWCFGETRCRPSLTRSPW
jgi:hypothetical protein